MLPDSWEQFRGAANTIELLAADDDYQNKAPVSLGGGGGGQRIAPPLGGGGGMDPWQQSVEKRLDSLDRRLTSIEGDVTQIRVDTGVLRADVTHLPTKGYINTAVMGALTVIAALTIFADKIQALVGLAN